MPDSISEDWIGREVVITRVGQDYSRVSGTLERVADDGVLVRTRRQVIGEGGFATGGYQDQEVFCPWISVDTVTPL